MTCMLLSESHLTAIAIAIALSLDHADPLGNVARTFKRLAALNALAYNRQYPSTPVASIRREGRSIDGKIAYYRKLCEDYVNHPLKMIKLMQCFDYQVCEVGGHKRTLVMREIHNYGFKNLYTVLSGNPEYGEAPWVTLTENQNEKV